MQHAAIFADGAPLAPALRNRIRRGRFTLALDGAAEGARREGWRPDLIAGDFDGVSRATLRYFEKKGVELLHTPDQEHTDLEKALAWCVLRGFRSIWIAQGIGTRLDHSFTALSLLRRYHARGRELLLFADGEAVRFLHDERALLRGRSGRRIAVLPFPRARVRSKGLRYEMHDLRLGLGVRESASNTARLRRVQLTVEGRALVVEALR